jgi:hypothetical protein
MGLDVLGPDDPGIIATQSTHKQLAGFSQASQIHLKHRHLQGQPRHVTEQRFNEAFLLHASTSPFYPLFASLDVGAQMMKGRNGFHLWNDATRLAVQTRKTIRTIRRHYEARAGDGGPPSWFFGRRSTATNGCATCASACMISTGRDIPPSCSGCSSGRSTFPRSCCHRRTPPGCSPPTRSTTCR